MNVSEFWRRLEDSQLIARPQLASLRSQFESEHAVAGRDSLTEVSPIVEWLHRNRLISDFQGRVLSSETVSRLRFGNYDLVDVMPATSKTLFFGRHRLTGHPVVLNFLGGDDAVALQRWRNAQSIAIRISQNPHPNLLRVYEPVAIPHYRFVVSELPTGQRMFSRIPPKSRVSAAVGWAIGCQLASVVEHLNQMGICNALSAERVWLEKSTRVRLAISFMDEGDASDDLRTLGEILFRLFAGRFVGSESTVAVGGQSDRIAPLDNPATFSGKDAARLKQLGLSESAIEFLASLFSPRVSGKPSMQAVVEYCQRESGNNFSVPAQPPTPPTQARYEEWLRRDPSQLSAERREPLDAPIVSAESMPPEAVAEFPIAIVGNGQADRQCAVLAPVRHRHVAWMPAVASLIIVASLIGTVVWLTAPIPNKLTWAPAATPNNPQPRELAGDVVEPAKQPAPGSLPESTEASLTTATGSHQYLIDDDQQTLWESPASGGSLSLSGVPPAAKVVIAIRLAELLQTENGQHLLRAFGPEINEQLQHTAQQISVPLENIQRLLVTLHLNDRFQYDPFLLVTLKQPLSRELLVEHWQHPELRTDDQNREYYWRDEAACFVVFGDDPQIVTQFAAGPQWLVEASLPQQSTDVSAGTIRELAHRTADSSQVLVLAQRSGLFDGAGQLLMGDRLAAFNQQFNLALHEHIRGLGVSLHLQHGTYVEFQLERDLDVKPDELQDWLQTALREWRDQVLMYATKLPANSHWDAARMRYGIMLTDLLAQTRVGVENRNVLANAWLAPAAGANLVATTELLLMLGQPNAVRSDAKGDRPATLEDLLASRRDLNITTNPDLIALLNNLKQEILDDYGSLPFEFEIRIEGDELSLEGITQNQRPGNFEIENRSLADILTEIMVRANPNKNIRGPQDPECKLVWAIQPVEQIVLITTRNAANRKKYLLPLQFQ